MLLFSIIMYSYHQLRSKQINIEYYEKHIGKIESIYVYIFQKVETRFFKSKYLNIIFILQLYYIIAVRFEKIFPL